MGDDHDLSVLTRWEDAGGVWQVTSRTATSVAIDLLSCSAGEVMGRLHTTDPAVLTYVAGHPPSD